MTFGELEALQPGDLVEGRWNGHWRIVDEDGTYAVAVFLGYPTGAPREPFIEGDRLNFLVDGLVYDVHCNSLIGCRRVKGMA